MCINWQKSSEKAIFLLEYQRLQALCTQGMFYFFIERRNTMKKKHVIMNKKLIRDARIFGAGMITLLLFFTLLMVPYFDDRKITMENIFDDLTTFLAIATLTFIIVDLASAIREYVDISCSLGVCCAFMWSIPHDPSEWTFKFSGFPLIVLSILVAYASIAFLTIAVKSRTNRW